MTVSYSQFEAKERMADDDLGEDGPENMVALEQQNHPSDTGRTISLLWKGNTCLAFVLESKLKFFHRKETF